MKNEGTHKLWYFPETYVCFAHVRKIHWFELGNRDSGTDETTLKCDKEFDGMGAGARREKGKRGSEDGWSDDLIRRLDQMICLDDLIRWLD